MRRQLPATGLPRCSLQPGGGFVYDSTMEKPICRWRSFLKDVLICSLGAYGGPEAHFGVFLDQMVVKRRHLEEEDLVELLALCSILPGPTSTQTIVAIGHKLGGPPLALLTMLVWSLPAVAIMIALSFLYQLLGAFDVSRDVLRFIGPMAIGFIIVAAWRIGRKVVKDAETAVLMLAGALATYWIRAPWIFPVVLVLGGVVSVARSREPDLWNRTRLSPPWGYGVAFAALAFGLLALGAATSWWWVDLFERFYRYGYLVFGGGQVVVPLMHEELVVEHAFMSDAEFLTGYGLVQGIPGPMFSFAAYAGGLAARGMSAWRQIVGGLLGGVGIFLPGVLLIFFVYPVWEQLKRIRAIRISLKGVNAVAAGLVAVAAVILLKAGDTTPEHALATVATVGLLLSRKIPAPLIVLAALLAGLL